MNKPLVAGPVQGPFATGERPVVILLNGKVAALVVASEHLTACQIASAYAEWTGFDISEVRLGFVGHNVLTIKEGGA